MRVGFVGLGIMGKPMAHNVLKAGHTVVAYDHKQAPIDEIVAAGGIAAANGREVAEQTDVVITMLPNSPHVHSALFDGDFTPGFRMDLHIKDLQNVLDTSHDVNVSAPFTSLAMEIMQSLKAHGHGSDDHSGIAEWYEMVNDLKLQD